MQEIAKTKFSTNYLYEDKSLLEFHWADQTELMQEEDFREALSVYVALVQKHTPRRILVNANSLAFVVTTALQQWVDDNISAVTNAIIQKMAVLLPTSFIEQLSIEQVLDEAEAKKTESKFFDEYEEALSWLMQE